MGSNNTDLAATIRNDTDLVHVRPATIERSICSPRKLDYTGDSVGYSRAYEAERDVWVATLPVGHVDGWPRAAAQGASVRIGGKHYPVIGAVSASHTIVELGMEPSVSIGDVATCFDWETGSRPEDVAAATGTSVYNIARSRQSVPDLGFPRRSCKAIIFDAISTSGS